MGHYMDHDNQMCLTHGLRLFSLAPESERQGNGPPVCLLYSDVRLHAIISALKKRIIDAMRPHTIGKVPNIHIHNNELIVIC